MSKNKPVVIAANFQGFKSWCWENGLHVGNAVCIDRVYKVRGMSLKRSQIRYAHNALSNPDILEIEQAVHLACLRGDENGDLDWFSTDRGRQHLAEQESRAELAQLDKLRRNAEIKAQPDRERILEAITNNLKLLDVAELKNLHDWMKVPGFVGTTHQAFASKPARSSTSVDESLIAAGGWNGPRPASAYIDEAQALTDFDKAAEARNEHHRQQYLEDFVDGSDD